MGDLAIEVQLTGLERVSRAIRRVTGWDRVALLDVIGRLVQLQTRQRIRSEKIGPNGELWPHNKKGSAPLYASGALHDSIDYRAGLGQVTVGSPLIYAAIHHFGGEIKPKKGKYLSFLNQDGNRVFVPGVTIPARPYIGISAENARELEDVVADFIAEVVQ